MQSKGKSRGEYPLAFISYALRRIPMSLKDMTTRRANDRRLEEGNIEQEVPPEAPPQAQIDPLNENVTNVELRLVFQVLAQAVPTQANREVVVPVNPNVEVYKVLSIMGVTPVEKAELAAYQLKGVAQIWFNQWKEARPVEAGPIECARFF
ncbi:hypothetical protein MTR67_039800 [Solanum verrucosum]|uniref:Gag-pol polyprotein n=1 Tax=Solanum verrucosum TaxID=315347 RepID=A0AAF0ZR31_SOLVR|nr:hypothetical protein MTR67_039800 [Solanum verrucosum]